MINNENHPNNLYNRCPVWGRCKKCKEHTLVDFENRLCIKCDNDKQIKPTK